MSKTINQQQQIIKKKKNAHIDSNIRWQQVKQMTV